MPRSSPCTAHNRRGEPCKRWAILGGTVCPTHGGSIGHVKARAADRLQALVHPAISALERLIDAGEFQAVKYVLDWAGFKAAEKYSMGHQDVHVRVTWEEFPLDYLAPAPQLNGHTHAN